MREVMIWCASMCISLLLLYFLSLLLPVSIYNNNWIMIPVCFVLGGGTSAACEWGFEQQRRKK